MKTGNIITVTVAIVSLGFSSFLYFDRTVQEEPASQEIGGEYAAGEMEMLELKESLTDLSNQIETLKKSIGKIPGDEADPSLTDAESASPPAFASIDQRLAALEGMVSRLQSNYDGISMEGASEEREQVFASTEGAIRADEYFEAGKYSIAAEGYMTYLRNNPDDPDARNVLERARRAYGRAGYQDMAIWTQEEMMRLFPENRPQDLQTLAELYKDAGNYDEAIQVAEEASELIEEPQARLWNQLYWAWYTQLRDGNQAGVDAYRQVQQEILQSGYEDHRLNERAQEKIDEILRAMSAPRKSGKVAKG